MAGKSRRMTHALVIGRLGGHFLVWLISNVGAIALFACVWEALPRLGVVDPIFLPPLSAVIRALWQMALSGELWRQVLPSLLRVSVGFLIATIAGITLGLVVAWWRPLARFFMPLLELFRNTAPLALLPVFLIIFGIGEISKIAIVIYAATFPILLNTIVGVTSVDPLLVRAARSMDFNTRQIFLKIFIPGALPSIVTGLRLGGAAAMLVLIAAELMGANAGIGFYIFYAQNNFLIERMYAAILVMSVLGAAVNYGLIAIGNRYLSHRASL